ncbi:sodium:proton antiporter NhaD [Gynuella sunshinyii]|uniref:Na+/H+ antiporter NhaD and related arsenite permease n=1 Tax=Gynuella sunshinyii YC6258 TaxID=1445510 RepID=A0A0C5VTD6_9GAMM|nr:sodium:proton antiporter NhaD [Gynuella sunshinyii]AJQ93579.1 Na+/H+ antiporter NhaD and related arsenite permease [Gynuella sunshinyii YC6258]
MSFSLILISVVFTLGYTAIVLEHNIKIDKTASAILTAIICWTLYIMFSHSLVSVADLPHWFLEEQYVEKTDAQLISSWVGEHELLSSLGDIASILFFLLGAMTIVEFVDAHGGFAIITDRIQASNMVTLLWIIGLIAFFLSAALDNLTTTIVMISLIRKLIKDHEERLFFAGIIVVAANAGGAWSPIGDVTTTMLWIGGQITTGAIIKGLLVPSLICLVIPLLYLSWRLKGRVIHAPDKVVGSDHTNITSGHRNVFFFVGIGGLLFVPVFKSVTHLPPFMGMLLSMSVLWIISEILAQTSPTKPDPALRITRILRQIDTPSVLFFLGILLAVGALEAVGLLDMLAHGLDQSVGNIDAIVFLIGLLSSVIDNVPLVAASMGMYDMATYPTNAHIWEFLAFAAGTGGSCLIIGSAAGVAAMGMEKINFFWYLKNISPLALLGYVSGAITYLFLF